MNAEPITWIRDFGADGLPLYVVVNKNTPGSIPVYRDPPVYGEMDVRGDRADWHAAAAIEQDDPLD